MKAAKPVRRLRIRTILLAVNIIILVLPLGSIYFLKIYEDELFHQTESELTAQGAAIISSYIQMVEDLQAKPPHRSTSNPLYGLPVKLHPSGYYQRVPETLEFSKEDIAPPFPDAQEPDTTTDSLALAAGKKMMPILKRTREITLAGLRLTDMNGIVVATSGIEYGLSLKKAPEIKRALEGQPSSMLRKRVTDTRAYSWTSTSRDTGLRVFVTLPIIKDHRVIGTLLLSRTPRSIKKALFDIRGRVIAAIILLLTVISFLTLFTALTISHPIESLIKRTQNIASGKDHGTKYRFNSVTREFELLHSALSEMAEKINTRSEYIKNFALSVSHEFKTPITSIQGTLELFQHYLETMTAEKKQRFLNNMLEDSNRLKKLVNRLLEMAKADVFQPGDDSTEVISRLKRIQERYQEKGLTVELAGIKHSTSICIAPEIFDTIISNILDNSVQHKANIVSIKATADEYLKLEISDNGEGISEANIKQIFDPFFSTTKKNGGTGMGLPIIRTLLQAHDGQIDYIPGGDGARFDIVIPIKAEV